MTSALVVIDVQNSFLQLPDWRHTSRPDIVHQVNRLAAAARNAGDAVVWVLGSRPGSGSVFDPARGFVRLMDGIRPLDGEPVLTKTAHNAFTTTGLHRFLTLRGVRRLTVCGIRTEQCCETTARLASDLGFEVDFAIDATATTPIPHRDAPDDAPFGELVRDPRTLGVDEIISRTAYALSGRFATIRTVDELTGN
ncbi:isochorismatase family protein [Planomonospora sp. ID91781]|uniref:Isochorismatase n=3 Tax=Planomonospora TaxID=1998 RepID=A0A171DQF5_9ACTN|nr:MULTISPECIES: isochorismatase family protein [Planomonospora]MBG0824961.1 isochorismatase family protein [Planomonospora sp. ID91781]GAT71296.1 isochorismatase [Planomonospora sphaerica]GGK96168.1 hydrolase [Planomonospora parontospora]GII12638.1 hydrolase [Planomonospora parontospora subsp. parontospora]